MNGILLGAASLGALIVYFTHDPGSLAAARALADDAEVARLMDEAPDAGSLNRAMMVDPATGERTDVRIIAFVD